MKNFFLYSITCLLVVAATQRTYSQDTIPAEVFTLPTCDPISSIVKTSGKNTTVQKPFRLEASSKMASVLRITGINPLRYRYFINNTAVTQFMESSVLTFSINPFVDKEFFATAPEIKVPEIFKTDSVVSQTRDKIKSYQNKNIQYEDSVERITSELCQIWSSKYNENWKAKQLQKGRNSFWGSLPVKNLWGRLLKNGAIHDRNLRDYQLYTSGLPINNPDFGILELYKSIKPDSLTGVSEVDSIRSYKYHFATGYCNQLIDFKEIDSILFVLETHGRYVAHYDSIQTIRDLVQKLRKHNFMWSAASVHNDCFTLDDTVEKNKNLLQENIRNVKEQILAKQFQLYQEFVINVATRIGVLMQNQFMEYSSFDNKLKSYSCLDDERVKAVWDKKNRLDTTLKFIKQTNAELQALVPYLDINSDLYQSIARRINANYLYLISYLQNLNFASNENVVQYTLPTHSNLKNIDLLRYTVKREDNITKTTQEYNYDFWLKGGLKIDFSFGMFATRLTDNVYNKVLLDTFGGIDNIRITRQDDGRASFAFGGMVNITPRNGARWLNVGGSIGLAYSDNKTLQVLTGASLHFGKTERIILHAGAAFGTIKYLDISVNDFKFNDRNDMSKTVTRDNLHDVKENDRVYSLHSPSIKFSSYTIPTVNKFVIRPFIGITYNLSGKNVLKAVSGEGIKTYRDNLNSTP